MTQITQKQKILFLCTGNSCRSQMAEGWAKHIWPDAYEAYSAGTEPHGTNLLAIKSMALAGLDISNQTSDHIDSYADHSLDFVITVCGHAKESCPVFSGNTRVIHVGFDDPPKLAASETDEDGQLVHYNRVRDEIRQFIETLPQKLS